MSEIVHCRDCKFYELPGAGHWSVPHCARWHYGYHDKLKASNDIIVECDEGWGANMGPDFGCVLGEARAEDGRAAP